YSSDHFLYIFTLPAPPEPYHLSLHDALPILLGVEPAQKDRDGKTHQIRVQVKRSGSTVRARREFRYTAVTATAQAREDQVIALLDRKSTRLNSSHRTISYAVFCLKKKKTKNQ